MQAGHDDGVELQAFGLVNRHELQLGVAQGVGRGVEARDFVVEAVELQLAVLGDAVERIEVGAGVEQVGWLREAQGPAEALPDAFDPAAGALLNLVRVGFLQHAAQVV